MKKVDEVLNVLMEGIETPHSDYNWVKKEDVVKEQIVQEEQIDEARGVAKVLTTDDVLKVVNSIPEDKLETVNIYARRTDGNMYPIISQCRDGLLVGGSKENKMDEDTNWIIGEIKKNFPQYPGNKVYMELDMFYWAQLRGKTVKYDKEKNMIIIDFRVERAD